MKKQLPAHMLNPDGTVKKQEEKEPGTDGNLLSGLLPMLADLKNKAVQKIKDFKFTSGQVEPHASESMALS